MQPSSTPPSAPAQAGIIPFPKRRAVRIGCRPITDPAREFRNLQYQLLMKQQMEGNTPPALFEYLLIGNGIEP
jgi:hypothetical protein